MSTWDLIKKYDIKPKKTLGQNFLIDNNIKAKMLNSINLTKEDLVIEVGPGLGVLTYDIAKLVKYVVAYEIDTQLVKVLNEIFNNFPNVKIINQDILKSDVDNCSFADIEYDKLKVIANLPYYITTPIIFKLLESNLKIHQIMVMVQKEVADRIVAIPGSKDYGVLSVAIRYFSEPKVVMNVSSKCFYPEPKVKSSIVLLNVHKERNFAIINREYFFKFIKAAFGMRRKTLVNALSNSPKFNFQKGDIEKILENSGINHRIRGEELSFLQFIELSNSFYNFGNQ